MHNNDYLQHMPVDPHYKTKWNWSCQFFTSRLRNNNMATNLQGWPTSEKPGACVTAKSHIIPIVTREHQPISFSLTHITLLSWSYCKDHTPIRQCQNFTSHLL